MKKNNTIISLLNEVGYLNKHELEKVHGKSQEPRINILKHAIKNGGHEDEDGNIVGVEMVDGRFVTPVSPNKSKYNKELIAILDSGNLDQLYAKGEEALKFHAYMATDDSPDWDYAYLFRITDIKKSAYFGGGRAAGKSDAQLTAAQEAIQAQALGYAIASGKQLTANDINPQTLTKGNAHVMIGNVSPSHVDEIFASEKWKESIAKTANALRKKYKFNGMIIHHGTPWVKKMMDLFNSVNKDLENNSKEFGHKDKWNPADIWAVKDGVLPPTEVNDLAELKAKMQQMFKRRQIIGISLKAVGSTAQVKEFNMKDGDIEDLLTLSIKDLVVSGRKNQIFSNKGSIIRYESASFNTIKTLLSEDNVETRTFQSSVDNVTSELKGNKAKAAGGKINFILTNRILFDVGLPTLTPKEAISAMQVKGRTKYAKYEPIINKIIRNAALALGSISIQ